MKRKQSKLLCLLLAAVLSLGVPFAQPQGAAAQETGGKAMLVAFDNETTIRAFGTAVNKDVRKSYATSGKWDHTGGGSRKQTNEYRLADYGAPTDWSGYQYYNFWMYSENANGAHINVLVYDSGGKYNRYDLVVDWEKEWKCVSIPISGPMLNNNIKDLSDVQIIRFNAGDWGGTVDPTTCLYFDSIWLSKEAPGERNLVAADFNQAADRSGFGFAEETEITLSAASGKWDHSGGGTRKNSGQYVLADHGVQTDWTPYAYFNVRVYSASANGAVINILAYGPADGYFSYQLPLDWTGWRTVRIPLGGFKGNKAITTWDGITYLQFNAGDWGTTVDPTTCLYFDKIWLSDKVQEEQDQTVLAMDSEAAITGFGLEPDTELTKSYGYSGKWDHAGSGSSVQTKEYVLADHGMPTDWSEQNYLLMAFYSAAATDADVNVLLYETGGGYYQESFRVDWGEGWKTIVLPLGAFSQSNTVSRLADISAIRLNAGGWGTTVNPETCLYLDQMWISPSGTVAVPDEQELIVFHNSTAAGKLGLAPSEDISYQGAGMSALWEPAQLPQTDALDIARSGAATDWSSYQYLNLWVYSRTADGSYFDVALATGQGEMHTARVDVNWEEHWRTISLPLADFTGGMPQSAVQQLSLAAGGQTEYTGLYLDRITVSKQLPTDIALEDAEIATFGTAADVRQWNLQQEAETLRYRPMTGRWEHSGLARTAKYDLQRAQRQTDWSAFTYFNLWVHSAAATNGSFSVVMEGENGYWRSKIPVDWEGWRLVSLPLSAATAYGDIADWTELQTVYLDTGGWDTSMDEQTVLCLDRMWLSREMPVGGTLPGTDSDTVLVAQFDNEAAINATGKLQVDTQTTHLYGMSGLWEDMPNRQYFDLQLGSVDLRGFSYYYQWVYSAQATNAEINLIVYTEGDNTYFRTTFRVDWTGWKLLEIPIGQFEPNSGGSPDWSKVTHVRFHSNAWGITADPNTSINLERLWFAKDKMQPLALTGSDPADGYDAASIEGPVTLAFNTELARTTRQDAAVLQSAGGETVPCTAFADGKNLVISWEGRLAADTRYQVMVAAENLMGSMGQTLQNGVSLAFTTAPAGLVVSRITFEDDLGGAYYALPESGVVAARAAVHNSGSQAQQAVAALAFYEETGRMAHLAVSPASGVNASASEDLVVRADLPSYDGLRAVAFVLESADGGLLSPVAGYLGGAPAQPEDVQASTQNTVALDTCSVTLDTVTLSGTLQSAAGRTLLLRVTDEAGKTVLLAPLPCGAGAAWSYSWDMDGEVDGGSYQVAVNGYLVDNTAEDSFYYLNDTEKKTLLAQANAAQQSQDAMQTLVAQNPAAFGLSGEQAQDETVTGQIALVLCEQLPAEDYTQLVQLANKALDLLAQLNSCDWTQLTAFLQQNDALVFHGLTEYNQYAGMDETAQKRINKTVLQTGRFRDFAQFRTAFANAVRNDGQQGGGTGGGSGTGGGGRRPSGGSQGTQYQVGGTAAPTPTPSEPAIRYTDLAEAPWAEESIVALTQRGIASGGGDGLYRPLDGVTREEFVKLLVEAFDLGADAAQCTFTDAQPDAWYTPYLAAAQQAGIVQGDGNGHFGVGDGITRQDAAVMAQRALDAAGKTLAVGNGTQPFTDEAQIAPYAVEDVRHMQAAGVLSGMGDGRFAPLEGTNRAQAAKIIYALLQAVQEEA